MFYKDIPNIILDPDRVEGQGATATPQSAARAGSGIRVSGGGVGRVNMTWSKADGSKPKPKPKKNPFEIDIEGLEDKPWRKPSKLLAKGEKALTFVTVSRC